MEEDKFDCIIVGGGVAGCSAAYILAKNNLKILLVEKGEWPGSKNVSGGVLWGPVAFEIFPDLLEEKNQAFERVITRRRLSFMSDTSSFSVDFHSGKFEKQPYNGVSVLRSRFDKWLGEKVEEAISQSKFSEDSFVTPGVKVDELIMKGGKVVGIRAGEDEFFSDCVILAEGVNSILTRQIGLQVKDVPAEYMATGIKEVWQLGQEKLENRFQLSGIHGVANEFVGCTQGIEGGGFLYTNRDSVSIGLVLGIASLRNSDKKTYDLLDAFKSHPSISPVLEGGKMVEYSAHVVPMGDMRLIPEKLYSDGVLVVGDAAGLLLNSGKSIEGMNMAMESGRQAALCVIEAKKKGDFSKTSLKSYQEALSETFVMKDIVSFQGAVHFLHEKKMFREIPDFINEICLKSFTIDSSPKKKTKEIVMNAVQKSGLSWWELLKMSIKGGVNL